MWVLFDQLYSVLLRVSLRAVLPALLFYLSFGTKKEFKSRPGVALRSRNNILQGMLAALGMQADILL